jgi:hypothetical protein
LSFVSIHARDRAKPHGKGGIPPVLDRLRLPEGEVFKRSWFSMESFGSRIAEHVMEWLPESWRTAFQTRKLRLGRPPSKKFVFKLAQTQDELEACFRLLHDVYVEAGFMKPDPSGLRVTLYHALPTTSTLMCRYGHRVVGTVSLIRKNKLGFPMQRAFDLGELRRESGNMAEVSALALDPVFRSPERGILMPLLKFLYEYAEYRFDTRHLLIAVHPRQIGFYERLFCFQRLEQTADHYDFVNGAPAVGAHLDLALAKEKLRAKYAHLPPARNLHHFFVAASLPNSLFPHRRFHTTTDPVMTPELIDYFFNQRTQTFAALEPREVRLLHAIHDLPEYKHCLPPMPDDMTSDKIRNKTRRRFAVQCAGRFRYSEQGLARNVELDVYECSESVFCAHTDQPLPVGALGEAEIHLGEKGRCILQVEVSRLGKHSNRVAMLSIRQGDTEQDKLWLKFVHALAQVHPGDDEGGETPRAAPTPATVERLIRSSV